MSDDWGIDVDVSMKRRMSEYRAEIKGGVMDTYVYRIRYKDSKGYWSNRDGRSIWLSSASAEYALEDYQYLTNWRHWRDSLEVVKFSLTEVRDECI